MEYEVSFNGKGIGSVMAKDWKEAKEKVFEQIITLSEVIEQEEEDW